MAEIETQPSTPKRIVELRFRWKYILLPLAVLFIAIVLFAVFYWQLTPEVAYRFNTDGSPKSWLSREMLALIMLQVISSGLNLLGFSAHLTIALWGAILIIVISLHHVRDLDRQNRSVMSLTQGRGIFLLSNNVY